MNNKANSILVQLLIVIISSLLFIPFLGKVHLFDWDEINFAEAAREMIASHNYLTVQINFKPFWEKPPLFIWLQVLSMKTFGINEFAARLPNAICGVFTLLFIYRIGKRIYDHRFGLIWVMTFAGSILPFFYFKSGIIDPLFNLFIFMGIYFLSSTGFDDKKRSNTINCLLSGLFIGLAVLTKGPVAYLIFFLTSITYLFFNGFNLTVKKWQLIVHFFVVMLVGGSWFLLQMAFGHKELMMSFIKYQITLFDSNDNGHGGFLFYHFIVLFFGVFPASIFALQSFRSNNYDTSDQRRFKLWMTILFWVVLILFTIVRTKIVHYTSLCYFPLTFLSTYVAYKLLTHRFKWKRTTGLLILVIGILYGTLIASIQFFDKYKHLITKKIIIKDQFALGNLQANANFTGYEFLIGVLLITGILIALYLLRNNRIVNGIFILYGTVIVFSFLTIVYIVPQVERYTQNAAIEFFEAHQSEDCYLYPLGYKSYAHYFYGRVKKHDDLNAYCEDSLLSGKLDKPTYFFTKISNNELKIYPAITKLYSKNGYVFYVRQPSIRQDTLLKY